MLALLVVALLAGAVGYQLGRSRPASPSTLPPESAEPTVAHWAGGKLTVAQLQTRVVALKTAAGLPSLDPARARAFADEVVQTALLATEAKNRGLEHDAQVQGPLAQLLARRLIEVEVEDPRQRPSPTEAEVGAYYNAHREDFLRPERIRLSVLVAPASRSDLRARAKAKSELEAIQQELLALPAAAVSEAMEKRARQRGASSGDAGVVLGALSLPELEARLGEEAAQAAWLLMAIERLEILETADAVLLVRLEGREAGKAITREEAREQIASRLWYERRDELLKKHLAAVRAKLELQVDDAALSRAVSDVR